MKDTRNNKCFECRDGALPDYDDDIKKVRVIDPDTNKVWKRGKMCYMHRIAREFDGYIVEEV